LSQFTSFARRIVLSRMRAAAFGSGDRGMQTDARLRHHVVELDRLGEIGVPDERMVAQTQIIT